MVKDMSLPAHEGADSIQSVLTRTEFCEHWGRGAPKSWVNLGKTAIKHEDFPLQPLPEDPTIMIGDLNRALEWLNDGRYSPNFRPAFVAALEKVQASRTEAEQAE